MNKIFASLYEDYYILFNLMDPAHTTISDGLWNNNLYDDIGLTSLFISLLVSFSYYYIINHPRFNKWGHWLIIMLISGIITFLVSYYWSMNVLIPKGFDPDKMGMDYEKFGISNFLLGVYSYIIWSFIIRWKSTNCSTTPIPQ